jgi:hypothetical protein
MLHAGGQARGRTDRHDMTKLTVPFPIVFLTTGKACSQMAFSPFDPWKRPRTGPRPKRRSRGVSAPELREKS